MRRTIVVLLLAAGCSTAAPATVTETVTESAASESRVECQDLLRGLTAIIGDLSAAYVRSETKANAGRIIAGEAAQAVTDATDALGELEPLVSTCVNG